MNKKELEKQIAEMQEQFDKMQKQLDELKQVKVEEPKKRWKPEIDEKYYFIMDYGTIGKTKKEIISEKIHNWRINTNNYFRTFDEAEEHKKKIEIQARFKNFVEERSEELDWENDYQNKYYLFYNYYSKQILFNRLWVCKAQGVIYASSEQILKDAIAEIGEENIKKYVLEVEE